MAVTRAAARKTPTPTPKTSKTSKTSKTATPKATPRTVNAANARAKAAAANAVKAKANAAKARANAAKVKANADKTVAKAKANADRVVARARANANRAKANAAKAIADAKAKANANAKAYAAAKVKIFTNTKTIQKTYDNTYASAKAEAKAKGYTNVEGYADAKAKAAAARITKIIASSSTVGQKLGMLERFVRSKAARYGAGSAAVASAAAYMSPEVGEFMFHVITSMGLSAAYVMRILKQVLDKRMIKVYRPKIEELMRQEEAIRRNKMLASAWSTTTSVATSVTGGVAEVFGRIGFSVLQGTGWLVQATWNVITSVNISVPEKLKFVQIFFGQDVPKYIKDIIASVQREGAQFVGRSTDLARLATFLREAKVAYWNPLANWIYEVYVAHKLAVGWATEGKKIEALKGFFGGTLPAFLREMVRGKPSPPPPPQERSTIVRQIMDHLKEGARRVRETAGSAGKIAGERGGQAWAGVKKIAGERGGQAWAGIKAGVKAGSNSWARVAKANPKLVEHILLGAGGLVALALTTYLITETTKAVYSQPSNDDRRRRRRHRRR